MDYDDVRYPDKKSFNFRFCDPGNKIGLKAAKIRGILNHAKMITNLIPYK